MRTVFVNPSNPRRKRLRTTKRRRKNSTALARRNVSITTNPRRRRRRRNAGITPFVSNPLILENPRRRRRRKRNPKFNLQKSLMTLLGDAGGSAIGAGINILGLRQIENDLLRNGARLGIAMLGGMFMPTMVKGSFVGATLYPMWAEVALMTNLLGSAQATEADLNQLSADLDNLLSDIDDDDTAEEYDEDEMYVP